MTAITRPRRLAGVAAALALSAALLAGCGGEGSDVDCNLDSCNVTFDRGVDANASILGVDVELVAVQDGQVILKVADNEIRVPVGQESGTSAAGLSIRVQEVTQDKVVLRVSKEQS